MFEELRNKFKSKQNNDLINKLETSWNRLSKIRVANDVPENKFLLEEMHTILYGYIRGYLSEDIDNETILKNRSKAQALFTILHTLGNTEQQMEYIKNEVDKRLKE